MFSVLDPVKVSVTPDDDVFRHLALTYSFNHRKMNKGQPCPDGSSSFVNGITNGAEWYPLKGKLNNIFIFIIICFINEYVDPNEAIFSIN